MWRQQRRRRLAARVGGWADRGFFPKADQWVNGGGVAPFAGAWIETGIILTDCSDNIVSPPSRGRGSKQEPLLLGCAGAGRPLRGGVDRNRRWAISGALSWTSPPSRGRGSKQGIINGVKSMVGGRPLRGGVDRNAPERAPSQSTEQSPPSRGRGSKRVLPGPRRAAAQAGRPLRGGVDRNTPGRRVYRATYGSPPSRGRGSKHVQRGRVHQLVMESPPSRGRGSKPDRPPGARPRGRRPLRGGVDRNEIVTELAASATCRPLRGGVDRNTIEGRSITRTPVSPPSRGRGSKPHLAGQQHT